MKGSDTLFLYPRLRFSDAVMCLWRGGCWGGADSLVLLSRDSVANLTRRERNQLRLRDMAFTYSTLPHG